MKKYKHKITGIVGELWDGGHLHFDRSGGGISCHETLWKGFVENSNDWEEIIDIVKAPEPLFYTEDSVPIFEGDGCWHISILDNCTNSRPHKSMGRKEMLPIPSYFKYFSSEKLAQKYIDDNKPVYSKKQIIDAINNLQSYKFNLVENDLALYLKL